MNGKIILAFLLGAAAGSAVTYYLTRDSGEEEIYVPVGDNHEEDDGKKPVLFEASKDLNTHRIPYDIISNKGKEVEPIVEPQPIPADHIEAGKVNPDMIDDDEEEEETRHVIPPEYCGEHDDYSIVSLSYYTDGILADDMDVKTDIEDTVGKEALDHFGEYEDDSVYVVDNEKKVYYEILKDPRSYIHMMAGKKRKKRPDDV